MLNRLLTNFLTRKATICRKVYMLLMKSKLIEPKRHVNVALIASFPIRPTPTSRPFAPPQIHLRPIPALPNQTRPLKPQKPPDSPLSHYSQQRLQTTIENAHPLPHLSQHGLLALQPEIRQDGAHLPRHAAAQRPPVHDLRRENVGPGAEKRARDFGVEVQYVLFLVLFLRSRGDFWTGERMGMLTDFLVKQRMARK